MMGCGRKKRIAVTIAATMVFVVSFLICIHLQDIIIVKFMKAVWKSSLRACAHERTTQNLLKPFGYMHYYYLNDSLETNTTVWRLPTSLKVQQRSIGIMKEYANQTARPHVEKEKSGVEETSNSNTRALDSKTAVVYICMFHCRIDLLSLAIHTLRSMGGWCGDVFVVVDEETRVSIQSDWNAPILAGEEWQFPSNVHLVVISRKNLLHLDHLRRQLWGDYVFSVMLAKRLKPQVLHVIPKIFTRIVFMDADVITVRSLHQFFRTQLGDRKHWLMFPDTICPSCTTYGSGVMLLQRHELLESCLARWLQLIDNPQYIRDQQALEEMLLSSRECAMIIDFLPRWRQRYMDPSLIPSLFAHNEWFVHYLRIKRHKLWDAVRTDVFLLQREFTRQLQPLCDIASLPRGIEFLASMDINGVVRNIIEKR
eukprot:m.24228 g.24228  ORF g.24228 m.24228 type:complete len:425 (-) comp5633_c0_seq1:1134-2408(-)